MNMMDPDDHIEVRPALKGPSPEQTMRFGCGCLAIVAVVIFLLSSVTPYANFLWFAHDARRIQVFTISYQTRGLLFAIAFVPALLLLYYSLSRALSVSLVYLRIPETLSEVLLSNALGWFRRHAALVTKLAALALAFFFALGFSNEWNTFLLATHVESFGKVDPIFGLDLGFFVFSLPWYLAIANFVFAVLLATTLVTIGIYVGMQMLASLARIELARPFVRMHVSSLIGLVILAFAAQLWLRRFEFGLAVGQQFTGAGYTGIRQLTMQTIAAVLVGLLGLATIVNGRQWKPFQVPIAGGIGVAAFYFLTVIAYPGLLQRFKVEPDKVNLEGPYAKSAIAMTRFGYGLDVIEARNAEVHESPTQQELADSQTTIDNMRLWDPEVLRSTLGVVQALRGFYAFNDVDVDRYSVNGKQTLTMISARDIYPEGLADNSRNWVTERLQYTHGFGVVISPVNTADSEGLPTYLTSDIPPVSIPDIPIKEPRIYFSDFRDLRREPLDEYALVDTQVREFDYAAGGADKLTRWTGNRGIPFGGLLTRIAFSILFQDTSPLVASNLTSGTRLLMHRNVKERCSLIYPFLQFDDDPYIVVLDGKLVWILDGYTTSGQIPYSAKADPLGRPLNYNYIRNSVKITVDAYTGETTAYAMDTVDPLLKAYRRIYPGLVQDASKMPAGLDKHLRYPEDLFTIQALQLTQYHVSDPTSFLNGSQAWDMPTERGQTGEAEETRPYFVQMRLPDEPKEGFLLILPFTPRQKNNLSGWLAAHCDPGYYGKLVLYQFTEGANIPGPSQMEATFNQDKVIADLNRQLNNDQSELVPGNLLLVPLGKSFLYVEPLFIKSRTSGIPQKPELKKVILALPHGHPVVADTYREALQKLFGDLTNQTAPPAESTSSKPTGTSASATVQRLQGVPRAEIQALAKLFDEMDSAQRSGDWAKYGELLKQMKAKIQELAK